MVKPERSFGSTYVLLGGKVSPFLAISLISSYVIGFRINATLYIPSSTFFISFRRDIFPSLNKIFLSVLSSTIFNNGLSIYLDRIDGSREFVHLFF